MTDSAPDTHGLQDQPDPPVTAASVVGAVRTENAAHWHLQAPEKVVAAAIRRAKLHYSLSADGLGEVAVAALHESGYVLMHAVCEACDEWPDPPAAVLGLGLQPETSEQ